MTKATFTIVRQCINCSKMFESNKRTTKYCSHKCNQQHYKLKKKLERKGIAEKELLTTTVKPKIKSLNLEIIKQKEYLTVKEVAFLFGCNSKTVYRMIQKEEIKAYNLSERLTRIQKKDIVQLFEKPKKEKPKTLTLENCYSMEEITTKFNVSRNTIYNYGKKHNIAKLKKGRSTYYSITDIDNLFNA